MFGEHFIPNPNIFLNSRTPPITNHKFLLLQFIHIIKSNHIIRHNSPPLRNNPSTRNNDIIQFLALIGKKKSVILFWKDKK